MCVCVTEAFVPSLGQPRSDRQWWEDLGVGGYGRGLTMKAEVGRNQWDDIFGLRWKLEGIGGSLR